ncbi:nucleotidyltransferase family protein [Methylomonas sp. LL1]|uniref:nucleotidyltransferase family protein n=1 Tax=Methylomonas sp. LL1 TaxID=2785785 RepID=UPI0018C3ADDA|nr:nucleotidyltransferase family protein [Methylomonas sp. LL1]QPK63133.1 nucleotidyltransferase family protein [Methylomonas sp. LL1]CAG1020559.1 mannose-1-phosphate guanylyltransferase [Methylococcales bacterium]
MKQHWRQVLIRTETTLRSTIEVIDRAALQIALVVDEQERLVGVVTDGDIRRALIRGLSLETAVGEVMNKRPKVASLRDSKAQLIAMMEGHHLYQLPVIDDQGRVARLESLQALYKQPSFPNPVFLMAGGFGKRLRPYTDECPKPLLEIGGKPILETIIENFVKSGFRRFYIAVHYRAEQIKDYFGDGGRWGVKIDYIDEVEPMGTAGAIGLLPDYLPDVPVIVMNGDILTQIDFARLLAYHNEQQAIATLCVRQYEYQIPYGVVNLDQQRVIGIEEKPLQSCLASAGIYVLDHSLIKVIAEQKQLDMPTLLNQQVSRGEQVAMFPIYDYWLDIGREADFLRAQGEFTKYF